MRLRDIRKVAVKGKQVVLRVDYNIEVNRAGKIRDQARIMATIPTIKWLLKSGARVILVSHRGRPTGRDSQLSLRPIIKPLQKLLNWPVVFIATPLFSRATMEAIDRAPRRAVVLLENIRFEPGEEDNSPAVAKRLAAMGDLAVNDAFSDSHRAHASIVGVAKYMPIYAGLGLQQEIKNLMPLVSRPARPYVAILGGAKISTKLGLIKKLLKRADAVLLGGALANTLLQAEGMAIGASLTEPLMLKAAGGLTVTEKKMEIPCDVMVTKNKLSRAQPTIRAVGNIKPREIIMDIGPDTIDLYARVIRTAKTVAWNGPMGVFERPPYDRGTLALAKIIANHRCHKVVGGGETIEAIKQSGTAGKFTWLSTGGGAMLEFIEGKTLPGIKVVSQP